MLRMVSCSSSRLAALAMALSSFLCVDAAAQQTGTVTGQVTQARDGQPIASVTVTVLGTALRTITGTDGRYTLERVPVGARTVQFRQIGQRPVEQAVTVEADQRATVDVQMTEQPVQLSGVVVTGASRAPERIVEAPAAVTSIDPAILRDQSVTGQAPRAVASVPGVDVVQSGMADYNVNTRGFNTTLNRRVLVLQDGRDLAVAFLGAQEWNAMSIPTEDLDKMEMVRGPGSALYGANAFSGVLNLTTPSARDIRGTKLTVAGGVMPSKVLSDSTGTTFRTDFRHAGVFADGRFGYRVNLGYSRTNTWSKARTRFDGTDMTNEYRPATDSAVANQNDVGLEEVRPLSGQTLDPASLSAIGTPDPLTTLSGAARLDYYADDGSVVTVDGGMSEATNGVVVTGLGRVQIKKSRRPWARAAWAADRFNVMAYYSGRTTPDSQATLGSGIEFRESSAILHVEGQFNENFANDNGRVVVGGSYRNSRVNTQGTLMPAQFDDRSDSYYSVFGQAEYHVTSQIRLVGALRYDDSNLYKAQFSPKAGIVYSLNDDHAVRLTFNHAFQTPNYSEWFLQAPASAPSDGPARVERGTEALFAELAANPDYTDLGLPTALTWGFDSLTFARALGNEDLEVETVDTWELGYKGALSDKIFLTVDVFFGHLKNFVTDLLPCVNPQYPCYSLTDDDNVPLHYQAVRDRVDLLESTSQITTVEADSIRGRLSTLQIGYGAVDRQLSPFLSRLPSGIGTAVVSYANAGRVLEYGGEVGLGWRLTDEWRVDGAYGLFEFTVREAPVDDLIPNSPRHRGSLGVAYSGRQGLDGNVTVRFSSGHQWVAGVFAGWVPSRQSVDLSLGYAINNNVRLFAVGTNLLDQQRFQMFGGSVIGRRVLAGATANF